jgi:hypothetical protein
MLASTQACRIGIVMFSLGSDKETFADDGSALLLSETFDLLRLVRAQEQLLDGAMSKEDMNLYESRAQRICELLQQLTR